jgi:hypothetical protein
MIETTPRQRTAAENYEATRFNALRHGVLSRFTVLPWEDLEEYCRLLNALVAEHKPEGATEEHLVEHRFRIAKRGGRHQSAPACRGTSVQMRDVSRHACMDVLQAYVRDADLFRDHAGAGLL